MIRFIQSLLLNRKLKAVKLEASRLGFDSELIVTLDD